MADRKPVNANGTDEIKHEIERTRVEMSETLGEIQDRLRPDHLLQQAKDGVTEAAKGKVRNIMSSAGDTAGMVAARAKGAGNYLSDYAMEHPIRIAVTVGALTWWMLRGRDRSYDWDGATETNWDDAEAMGSGDGRSLRDRAGEYVSSARETVGEYAASARETVGAYASSARDKAGEYASSARQAAGEYAGAAATRARSAANSTGDWVTENPMAAGAIALAIGAAIGMSMPRTELEDCTMGETRDRAWEKASRMAQNIKDNMTEKVSTAAENFMGETLKNAADTPSSPMTGEGRA